MKFEHLVRSVTLIFMLISSSLIVKSSELSELNESECLIANGQWTVPLNVDVREGDTREPHCTCSQGFYFNNGSCIPISNKILCESSGGVWSNSECICPTNSVGWADSVGCDYLAKIEGDVQKDKPNLLRKNILLISSALILIVLGIAYIVFKRKPK